MEFKASSKPPARSSSERFNVLLGIGSLQVPAALDSTLCHEAIYGILLLAWSLKPVQRHLPDHPSERFNVLPGIGSLQVPRRWLPLMP